MTQFGLLPLLGTTETDYELRDELEVKRKDGSLIRDKCRMLVEDVIIPQAFYALTDPEASHATKLDYARQIIDIADVKPKPNVQPPGAGFAVNIVIPEHGAKPTLNVTPATIDGVAIERAAPHTLEPDPLAAQPAAAPVPFKVPDFVTGRFPALDDDLRGPVPAQPQP